jgi:calcineurin-like phosphoesterase family protein
MTQAASENNALKDRLYALGSQQVPTYIFEWFFRYFAGGPDVFKSEPLDMLDNYQSLFSAASKMLAHKKSTEGFGKVIIDTDTPDYTYYFVGDTHGSFSDTYTMIDYFIKVFQVNPKVKVVWIGDIVDRNPYDLQNLALVLSFWLIFPDNVFIVRGNHEDSSVCSRYGFSQHLYDKAGDKPTFTPIWDMIIEFFSQLPLGMFCTVGDKNVFVVHGGIPFDVDNYSPLSWAETEPKLDCYKAEHFDMDKISQTMLWGDPDPNLSEGVAPTPRTGRPRFSQKAFNDFCSVNNISCIVRAHQKWQNGYKLFFNNRLISLFSTSYYDSRRIGDAKFLRLRPDSNLDQLGVEDSQDDGYGFGILKVDSAFLNRQLLTYYKAEINPQYRDVNMAKK